MLPSSNDAEVQATPIDISASHAGRRSLLLHHPSEACPNLLVSSRAEQGASAATAVPRHHDASLGATTQDKDAERPAELFWRVNSTVPSLGSKHCMPLCHILCPYMCSATDKTELACVVHCMPSPKILALMHICCCISGCLV